MPRPIETWLEIGERVAHARKVAGLTQLELASQLRLDRTAISKIEAGQRQLDSMELARLSNVLDRSVDWFLFHPPSAVVARRISRPDVTESRFDLILEDLARDVELLLGLNELQPPEIERPPFQVHDVEAAAEAASWARRLAMVGNEAVHDLTKLAERLGLYAFTLDLGTDGLDGSYVAVGGGGVALINGAKEPGRRRFTLAHEIGHHFLDDSYSKEWLISGITDDRERLIDAFAIHLLMPAEFVRSQWQKLGGSDNAWGAAVRIAAECAVSWSACLGQLSNLGLVAREDYAKLSSQKPVGADFMELGITLHVDLVSPCLSAEYLAAVIRAFRKHKIGAQRAEELLHGKLTRENLPTPYPVPPEAQKAEFESF